MANLQKDGTYSVVPRVAGGEITPEGLIVIGQVAQDFGLYTKITGGQRIDLFGARLEQLPAIWKRLVDAGFESGQAYGKALRTVKSCVGTSWCRYGVQDSVGLAVALEMRYRGLRAPHKIKLGVSGCARECAEARGKDVGVIATENGWNLYVGGNGGFTPRHAQLFAEDLDTETAGPQPSTGSSCTTSAPPTGCSAPRRGSRPSRAASTAVRAVVLEDSLGIGADLDAAMAAHVDELRGRVGGDARRPGEAGPVRLLRQRAGRRPTRRWPTSTERGQRDPRPPPSARPCSSPARGWRFAYERPVVDVVSRSTGWCPERGAAVLVDGTAGGAVPGRRGRRGPGLRGRLTATRSARRT